MLKTSKLKWCLFEKDVYTFMRYKSFLQVGCTKNQENDIYQLFIHKHKENNWIVCKLLCNIDLHGWKIVAYPVILICYTHYINKWWNPNIRLNKFYFKRRQTVYKLLLYFDKRTSWSHMSKTINFFTTKSNNMLSNNEPWNG